MSEVNCEPMTHYNPTLVSVDPINAPGVSEISSDNYQNHLDFEDFEGGGISKRRSKRRSTRRSKRRSTRRSIRRSTRRMSAVQRRKTNKIRNRKRKSLNYQKSNKKRRGKAIRYRQGRVKTPRNYKNRTRRMNLYKKEGISPKLKAEKVVRGARNQKRPSASYHYNVLKKPVGTKIYYRPKKSGKEKLHVLAVRKNGTPYWKVK